MSDDQKRLLEKQLWAVADTLRSSMNADEYKNYILGFIFYKYLSEKQAAYADTLLKADKLTFANLDEKKKADQPYIEAVKTHSLEKLGFFLSPNQLFSELVKKGRGDKGDDKFILEDLKAVLNSIEQTSSGTDSEDDFKGLFADVDLTSVRLGSSEKIKNERVVEILTHLSKIDFKLEDSKSDVLGDAYEYLISQFAAGAGKKAGEFYTPSQVSRLMAMIVTDGKKKLRSVYDPTCGSGSLLLRLGDYADVAHYYGQEYNTTTYNLARMNMILHGVHYTRFKIENGNTLTDDKLPDLKAEAVVANPPFSAQWKGDTDPTLISDERYSQYGKLAPKSKADYAFVAHMIHHLSDNGVMAVVLPHAVLFRPDSEEQIRKHIVEKLNYLDAVIGLPPNLFYGTNIPAAILIFKKCRKEDDDIFFLDASKEYLQGKKQNYLSDDTVNKIFKAYKNRNNVSEYSAKVTLEEIRRNEYNLNISRYVPILENDDNVTIIEVVKKLDEISKLEHQCLNDIATFCKNLNVPIPNGGNINLLKKYKKGLLQSFFSQEIRFKDNNGKFFDDWEPTLLSNVLFEHQEKSSGKEQVYSVSVHRGLINQIEHLGRSYAAEDTSKYNLVKPNDIVYTKSPTGGLPYGIIKQSKVDKSVIVSPLYGVFTPETPFLGTILDAYFESKANTNNYLYPIVQKGAKNTLNITNKTFLSRKLILPKSHQEQEMIATLLNHLDDLLALKTGDFKI
jgi:type I restriction enzyme M protein